jgi:ATP-dependent Clp protease adapter protein ClpS
LGGSSGLSRSFDKLQSDVGNRVEDQDQDLEEDNSSEIHQFDLFRRHTKPEATPGLNHSAEARDQESPHDEHSKIDDQAPEQKAAQHLDTHERPPTIQTERVGTGARYRDQLERSTELDSVNPPSEFITVFERLAREFREQASTIRVGASGQAVCDVCAYDRADRSKEETDESAQIAVRQISVAIEAT